ncbi:MAG: alpha-D-ribose 1-methylphosphonate 5-triphosphate diphosphatase [Roseovarius confluentis]
MTLMWIKNVRAALPSGLGKVSVHIDGNRIAEISDPVNVSPENPGLLLLPGFVDMHGDMIEREIEPRPHVKMPMELGLRDLDKRLAGSGVTTAYASVSFNPMSAYGHVRSYEHSMHILRSLKAMRPCLSIDHRVHARFEINYPKALSVVEELIADGTVDLVSLTDHTPGQGQYRDLERLFKRIEKEGKSPEEARAQVAERIREKKSNAGDAMATIRAMAALCARSGVRLASHDDDTPEKVALMSDIGAVISEFPVTLAAARAARDEGMMTAMGAPNALRGESYSGNLSARDAHREGVLDILAADYHPSAILPAILALADTDPGGIAAVSKLASANPARALGLSDRGEIRVGQRADLVLASDEGIGHVVATISGGRVVYSDGTIL